jgi:hypothetical protein
MTVSVRTSQRSRRAVSRGWVAAHPGGFTLLRENGGQVELRADFVPDGNRTRDLGDATHRFRHAWVQEFHTGDLCLGRDTPEGPAHWRIVEWPDRIEATDQTGRRFSLLLVAHDGPWWKRQLRRALLSILT